jgi:siroheme synthase
MGLGQRARIAERLLGRGWASETPAAVIVGAATAQSWSWTGTLSTLAAVEIPAASAGAPGLLVVGAVVGLAAELAVGLSTDLSDELADKLADKLAENLTKATTP